MENNNYILINFLEEEFSKINNQIGKIKLTLINEGYQNAIPEIEQELWDLYLESKILENSNEEAKQKKAILFLKSFINFDANDILYMIRNQELENKTEVQKIITENEVVYTIDKKINLEELKYLMLSTLELKQEPDKKHIRK